MSETNEGEGKPVLPRRLTLLGEALRPILGRLYVEVDQPVAATETTEAITDVARYFFKRLRAVIERLSEEVNTHLSGIVSCDDAGEADVYRAAGRFEGLLEDLLHERQAILKLDTSGADTEARDLLASICRHTLIEVRNWLTEMVEVLTDPIPALKRRGLPTSGRVELPIALTLTVAPQFAALSSWIEREASNLKQQAELRKPKTIKSPALHYSALATGVLTFLALVTPHPWVITAWTVAVVLLFFSALGRALAAFR